MDEIEEINRELMRKSRLKGKKGLDEFVEFIEVNFIPSKSDREMIEIKNNIKALNFLDNEEEIIIKSRMHQLVEDYDPSKYFPTAIVIFGMIISAYKLLSDMNPDSNLIKVALLLLSLVVPIYFLLSFKNFVKIRNTLINFNHLINKLEFMKDKSLENEKKIFNT